MQEQYKTSIKLISQQDKSYTRKSVNKAIVYYKSYKRA